MPTGGKPVQEQGKKMALVRSLLAGIAAGVLAGSTLGVVFIFANRYLAAGQAQLALASLRDFGNRYALRVGLFFLGSRSPTSCLLTALDRRWKRARAATEHCRALDRRVTRRPLVATGRSLDAAGALVRGGFLCSAAWRSWGCARPGSRPGTGSGCGAGRFAASRVRRRESRRNGPRVLAGVNAATAALASHRPARGPTSC